jgi:hypothetical protein
MKKLVLERVTTREELKVGLLDRKRQLNFSSFDSI